ncbi:MAG: hypothetical protein ACR2P7_04970 [bacterium]
MNILKRISDWLRKNPEPKANNRVQTERIDTGHERPTPNKTPEKKKTQVVIGLDFGTAFTKVVISGEGQKYAIPFNGGKEGVEKYLLPTRIYEDSSGNYTIDKPKHFSNVHTDLKMRILNDNLDADTKKRIIYYIAFVLQKSRDWLMNEKQAIFSGSQLMWMVNIGLPTEKNFDAKLQCMYRRIVEKAWRRSTNPCFGTNKEEETGNFDDQLHPESIQAFPEFAVQIKSYISSPQRQDGIHTLIDVGAGTVDVAVFGIFVREGENKLSICAESVKNLGIMALAQHRLKSLNKTGTWTPSPQDSFPSDDKFAEKLGVPKTQIEDADAKFRGIVVNEQINPTLRRAKEKDPKKAEWRPDIPLPLMLCGGGARVDLYKKITTILAKPGHGGPLQKTNLPEFDNLSVPSLPKSDKDRLSVAYGLSFEAFDIEEVLRIDTPIENPKKNTSACPRCNGTGSLHGICPRCGNSGFV